MKIKDARKKPPPDARVISALALLLEGFDENRFDEALTGLIQDLRPRIKRAWAARRLKRETQAHALLQEAMKTGEPLKVLETIVTNEPVMALITQLQTTRPPEALI